MNISFSRNQVFASSLLAICLSLFGVSSAWGLTCTAGDLTSTISIDSQDDSGESCVTLFAGQTIDAGEVCVSVNGENLDVTYNTYGGWELEQTHLWVGSQLSDMPQGRKGNPKVGLFPYKSGDITGATSYTETIPLADLVSGDSCDLCGTTYHVAAHAALRLDNGDGTFQTETGWGNGDPLVDRGSWATAFTIDFTCDGGGGNNAACETAYATTLADGAKGSDGTSSCFTATLKGENCGADAGDPLSQKWGWQIGPITSGTTATYNLHAGGGQCDTNKGFVAGTVDVAYDGEQLTVTYTVTAAGEELGATHVYAAYVGSCTSAPGQFEVLGTSGVNDASCDMNSSTVNYGGFDGSDIYLIGHAEICPDTNTCSN